nr:hypothetical protein GCM10023233_09820 [Brevibacterium otitidis]
MRPRRIAACGIGGEADATGGFHMPALSARMQTLPGSGCGCQAAEPAERLISGAGQRCCWAEMKGCSTDSPMLRIRSRAVDRVSATYS